jgi:hypothetical protein
LNNSNWNKIFIDAESGNLKTDKPRQNLAINLILKKIGINLPLTQAEENFMSNFDVDITTL